MKPRYLFIAEKPSLMRTVKHVYDTHAVELPYEAVFIAQHGHLVGLKQPDELDPALAKWDWAQLPLHPEDYGGWEYVPRDNAGGHGQASSSILSEIRRQIESGGFEAVVNLGDPDQEGELLIQETLHYVGNTLPVLRFWSNDLTEGKVFDALRNLRDDDHDPMLTNLYAAAVVRQRADYLFGMNGTRAATLRMGGTAYVGRVQTCMTWIVYKRELDIRNFKPKTVYGVRAEYAEGFQGTLFDEAAQDKSPDATEEQRSGNVWFDTRKEAEALVRALPNMAKVVLCERKRTTTFAPKLYKLATLQVDAGKLGIGDADALAALQSLYEKKYTSYPRTDCEYVSSHEDFYGMLRSCMSVPALEPFIRKYRRKDVEAARQNAKWVNDKQIEDAGHTALCPTAVIPDMVSLTDTERTVYTLVATRFASIFMPPLIQDRVVIVTDADGYTFRSTGKTLVQAGFTEMTGTEVMESYVPAHKEGDVLEVSRYSVTQKTSVCPKRFTSPELVGACEAPAKWLDDPRLRALGRRLRIGTPATRSPQIRTLIDRNGYIAERLEGKRKVLYPTAKGELIMRNLDGCAITRPDMSGIWEERLDLVRKGELEASVLERDLRDAADALVDEIRSRDMEVFRQAVCECPECGRRIYEGPKGYYCAGFRADPPCRVGIWKECHGVEITPDDCRTLLAGGTVQKQGRGLPVTLHYDRASGSAEPVMGDTHDICACPFCDGRVVTDGARFRCARCGFQGDMYFYAHPFTDKELATALEGGCSEVLHGLVGRGRPFDGFAVLDRQKRRLVIALVGEDGRPKLASTDGKTSGKRARGSSATAAEKKGGKKSGITKRTGSRRTKS